MKFVKRSIQTKIFISFLLVMILPTSIISISSYLVTVYILKDKVSRSFAENLSYISNNIERNLAAMEEISEYLSVNDNVKRALSTPYDNDVQFFLDMKKVDQHFNDFVLYSDFFSYVSSVILLGENGRILLNGNDANTIDTNALKRAPWYRQALQQNGNVVWIGIHEDETGYRKNNRKYVISLARTIKNSRFTNNVGMAYLSFDSRLFADMFVHSDSQTEREIMIVDNHNRTVYHSDGRTLNKTVSNLDILKNQTEPYSVTEKMGRQFLAATHWIEKYDWLVVETIPMDELLKDSQVIFQITSIVFFISFLFSGVVWYFVASSIVRPIKKLTDTIRSVRANNILVKADIGNNDEIGLLNANFNYMMDRIHTLIQNVLEEQELKRDAEYKALQAQINPHFLRNTLNTIRWMAIIQKADNIKEVVEVLGRLLKNTVYISGQFSSIEEELENLKDYLYIQKIRYKDKFDVMIKMDESVKTCRCIKFILQPLVENAIFHGIEPREERGNIWIQVTIHENIICITVKDDGVGMTPAQIEGLLSGKQTPSEKYSGIGVKNVHERIQMTYGRQFGLEIESEVDQYTCIKVCFPKQQSDTQIISTREDHNV